MIYLKKLTCADIFKNNIELTEIWPEVSSRIMQEATLEALENNEDGLYCVMEDNNVIGMTGFYELEEPFVGLRWHGLIHKKRNERLSPKILKEVAALAKKAYPECEYIAEFVPLTNYSDKIIKHFTDLGFEKFGPVESHDWTPHKTQGYAASLDSLINLELKKTPLIDYLEKELYDIKYSNIRKTKEYLDLSQFDIHSADKNGTVPLCYLLKEEMFFRDCYSYEIIKELVYKTDLSHTDNNGVNVFLNVLFQQWLEPKEFEYIFNHSNLGQINHMGACALTALMSVPGIKIKLGEKQIEKIVKTTDFNAVYLEKHNFFNLTLTLLSNQKEHCFNEETKKYIVNQSFFNNHIKQNFKALSNSSDDIMGIVFRLLEDKERFLEELKTFDMPNNYGVRVENLLKNNMIFSYIEKSLLDKIMISGQDHKMLKI